PLGLDTIDVQGISLARILHMLRHRIRYYYATSLKSAYGKEFVLMGNTWRKHGVDGVPFDYDVVLRNRLYGASRVCVDFLSGNGSSAHYHRVAELITFSDGTLQLQTTDSESLFGDQTQMRTF